MGSGGIDSAITLQNNEFLTGATVKPPTVPGMNSKAKDSIGPELGRSKSPSQPWSCLGGTDGVASTFPSTHPRGASEATHQRPAYGAVACCSLLSALC